MSQETLDNLDILDSIEAKENADLLQAVEAETQQEQQSEAADLAAQQGAAFAVGMVESLVKLKWAFVQIDEGIKQDITEKAVPVFRKYGGDLPSWLQPYREEIELGVVVAVAGFGIYSQVKAKEAKEAEEQQEKKNDSEADQPQYSA
ncbi:hypothetical protein [Endozoicomonas atrinae]|uniref:hypothetical protein n=1 Tax=Endozoicomonas atrinae TaxID=1333660 RepID=UPI000826EE6D|nr:hypothetical protein [Endozoicomonas atrinae]